MGEGSKMKNNIANTEKEAKMDKGVKMKKTAKQTEKASAKTSLQN